MTNRTRVGFWSHCLSRAGGTERWHETILRNLDYRRIEVLGLAVADPKNYDNERGSLMSQYCPVVVGPEAAEALATEVDVLVVWGMGHLGGILPECRLRPKVIYVSHGDTKFSPDWNVASARVASVDVDWYVGVSRAAARACPEDRAADTIVIPNGVDISRLTPMRERYDQRRAWGVPPGKKVLGFLGRASAEKDPRALARCVAHLPDDWVGAFIGDGDEFIYVRADAFVATRGIGRVYFPGPTHDVGSALIAFDALLSPSISEGFGLSIVEAWAIGVPVIATSTGVASDHPELVRIVPERDDGRLLAKAVLDDMGDYEGTSERVAAAKMTARSHYSAAEFGDTWSKFLCHVGGKRAARPDHLLQSGSVSRKVHHELEVAVG